MQSDVGALRSRLQGVPEEWRSSFVRRLAGVQRAITKGRDPMRLLRSINREIDTLITSRELRLAMSLRIAYPEDLPISQARDEIKLAMQEHQVTIVCGETGSGKTTQIPKICAELGRGINGMIGHTQPRRVAARSVAARVAQEMGTSLGEGVGYAVRFNDRTIPGTRVKMMTDGILLSETQHDRDLLAYDTIIIDEAHERSLNIDFLLGYLVRLLPRRPELKVIVTSATIDPERFSSHFNGAPIVRVQGRSHPVEIRWSPSKSLLEEEGVLPASICDAVEALDATDLGSAEPTGLPDILVFLPGEQEIHEARRRLVSRGFRDTEILPLYAQLPAARQDEVFNPRRQRRIVLATNVAETSLTVPRIRAVIDSGLVRMSRYSAKSRVQRLPIEDASRASANQRAGRCGRIGPGICIRLYDEENFQKREEFTQPEIKRANLASVILQMHALGLGRPDDFPFLQKPSMRLIKDGYETLEEIGAVDAKVRLTDIGRRLAKLPVDPRIGRMIFASIDENCISEILVIASALAVQDPRLRPADERSSADFAHAAFRDSGSDFLTYVRLWVAIRNARKEKGASEFKSWCRRSYLSVPRIFEWESVCRQLRDMVLKNIRVQRGAQPMLPDPNPSPSSGAVHRSILSGFLSNVGHLDESGEYSTPSGARFGIFPGSVLKREKPPWVVCAEIVETTRLWGRTLGRIRGEWIEHVAPNLLRREILEPHFVPETGHVAAWERVQYQSLVTTERRRVPFEPIDPTAAREVFIQEALIEEKLPHDLPFLSHNRALRDRVRKMEDRGREYGLLVDDETRYRFFDSRIPCDVFNVAAFEAWRRQAERRDPNVLYMNESDLLREKDDALDLSGYPDRIVTGGVPVLLRYTNDLGDEADGVTARVDLETLGGLDPARFEWLVPGLLAGKIEALIRSLPRKIRTRFMPIQDTARDAAEHLPFGEGSLFERLGQYLDTFQGATVTPGAFQMDLLEPHHFMRFELVDGEGGVIERTRQFEDLLERHRDSAREAFEDVVKGGSDEDDGASRLAAIRDREEWDFVPLPTKLDMVRNAKAMTGYPALSDEGETVRVRVNDDPITASFMHHAGVRRLFAIQVEPALRHHLDYMGGLPELAELASVSLGDMERGLGDLSIMIAAEGVSGLGEIRDREAFLEFDEVLRQRLWPALEEAQAILVPLYQARKDVAELLASSMPSGWQGVVVDERSHMESLVPADVASCVQPRHLRRIPLFLEAIPHRFEKLRGGGERRDAEARSELEGWLHLLRERHVLNDKLGKTDPKLIDFRWMLEEYRVALFAQELSAHDRVSSRQLLRAWKSITEA